MQMEKIAATTNNTKMEGIHVDGKRLKWSGGIQTQMHFIERKKKTKLNTIQNEARKGVEQKNVCQKTKNNQAKILMM